MGRRGAAGVRFVVAVLVAATVGAGLELWVSQAPARAHDGGRARQTGVDTLVRRRVLIGRSVRGSPIVAMMLGDPDAPRKLLVVGCIHGDERAGVAVAHRLESGRLPRNAAMWIIADLNPDGVATNTRQNAHGVDLNRNFPWRWHRIGHPGSQQYSGRHVLSEPESRIARRLILRVRPHITIWFHQPLGVVDESGGNVRIERHFARLVGIPLRRLARYRGSAASWQNHYLQESTAFVVELPPGRLAARLVPLVTGAVRRIAGDLSSPYRLRLPR